MNDDDFIKGFSEGLYGHYNKAKQVYNDAPALSLIHLRGYINDLCVIISCNNKEIVGLETSFERIEMLCDHQYIGSYISGVLHEIRKDTNKGAHPEEYSDLSVDKFYELAELNLKKCCKIIEKLYFKINQEVPPRYNFEKPEKNSLKDLCYEAVINSDPEAQYLVGFSLKSKADSVREKELKESKQNHSSFINISESESIIEKSKYWFEQSAYQYHPKAMYEYSCMLRRNGIPEEMVKGDEWVERAANEGEDNALSALGLMYIHGTETIKQDYKKAFVLLEKAAKSGHPAALTNLGAMYADGTGGVIDFEKAFEYSLKGALAGYPEAQFNVSNFYFKGSWVGENNEKGLYWLEKSVNQGLSRASMKMACLYMIGEILPKDTEKAYKLYWDAINSDDIEAMFSFAMACNENLFNKKSHIVEAANMLQLCYERANDDNPIRKQAYEASPFVVKKLHKYMQNSHFDQREFENALLANKLFDDKGFPCPNRRDRMKDIATELLQFRKNCESSGMAKNTAKKQLVFSEEKNQIPLRQNNKVGRNELCPCGSGKKYKKCCGE